MSNQLSALLNEWHKAKDDTEWVLGTVYKTEGSAYRKAGAMMLINGSRTAVRPVKWWLPRSRYHP